MTGRRGERRGERGWSWEGSVLVLPLALCRQPEEQLGIDRAGTEMGVGGLDSTKRGAAGCTGQHTGGG